MSHKHVPDRLRRDAAAGLVLPAVLGQDEQTPVPEGDVQESGVSRLTDEAPRRLGLDLVVHDDRVRLQ